MTAQSAIAADKGRISFNWIIDKKNDLLWYIGSALVGWLYAGLILIAVWMLPNPLEDSFGVIKIGGLHIPLTLELLVYSSWAYLVDAPHIWSTLARTFFDPEERRIRRRELWLSWGWFFLGPVLVLTPHVINWFLRPTGYQVPQGVMIVGPVAFVVFFRLWAYYHVVRQHWGFFMLYKRKNNDMDQRELAIDKWFFNLAFYTPLVMFMTSAFYNQTPGVPRLGLDTLHVAGYSVAGFVHRVAWFTFLGAIVAYLGFQMWIWMRGRTLNGPKLLFLLAVVPLHLLAFSNPWLAALMVPIVTVGHNIQYHRIVWMYGQNKYENPERAGEFRAARVIFSRFWIYFGLGLLFTFALYRGPWIEWLQMTLGLNLDRSVLAGVGMMAGLKDPSQLTLGQQLFGSFLVGWAFQHYYLDSKIWRVGRDKSVARQLKVES